MTAAPTASTLHARANITSPELELVSTREKPYPSYDPKVRKVYLAGPMRGYDEFNFPAFFAATADLRARGFTVFSPAERDLEEDGFDPKTSKAKSLAYYMQFDLPAVCQSHAVVVLPGWEESQGARLEVHVARECGLHVLSYPTLAPVRP